MTTKTIQQLADIQAEKALLGAVLLNPDMLPVVQTKVSLRSEHFALPAHGKIWRAMERVYEAVKTLDVQAVLAELRTMGVTEKEVGLDYLTGLLAEVDRSYAAEYLAEIVRDYAARRAMAQAAREAFALATRTDLSPAEAAARAEKMFRDVQTKHVPRRIGTTAEAVDALFEPPAEALENAVQYWARWGFPTLDKSSQLYPGDLVVLVGYAKVGKSMMALATALNNLFGGPNAVARINKQLLSGEITSVLVPESAIPVLYFSGEMDQSAILIRALAMLSGVAASRIHEGRRKAMSAVAKIQDKALRAQRYKEYLEHYFGPREMLLLSAWRDALRRAPFRIVDMMDLPRGYLPDVRATAWTMLSEIDTERRQPLVIVDYIGLYEPEGVHRTEVERAKARVDQVTAIARELGAAFNAVTLGVMQMSREGRRAGKPDASHMAWTSAAERNAAMIVAAWMTDEQEERAEMIVDALRRGQTQGLGRIEFSVKVLASRHGPSGAETVLARDPLCLTTFEPPARTMQL